MTLEELQLKVEKLDFDFKHHNHDSINSKPIDTSVGFKTGRIGRAIDDGLVAQTIDVGFRPKLIIVYSICTDPGGSWSLATYDVARQTTQGLLRVISAGNIIDDEVTNIIEIQTANQAAFTTATISEITNSGFVLDWTEDQAPGYADWIAFK